MSQSNYSTRKHYFL